MNPLTQQAMDIWWAGVEAVRGKRLISDTVIKTPDGIEIEGSVFNWSEFDRVLVVGAGKAGRMMTGGLMDVIGDAIEVSGHVNVPDHSSDDPPFERWMGNVRIWPGRPAGVNEPTNEGIEGTHRILELVRGAGPRDLVFALISGGGSALLPLPREGLSLEDKLATIRHLSASGANIEELNIVRCHLSDVKGGGLAAACRGKALVTLVLSDVLGDPLDLIASGPTVDCGHSSDEAKEILSRFDSSRTLPESVYQVLDKASLPKEENDERMTTSIHVVGSNAIAVDGAGILAESIGKNHIMHSSPRSEDDVSDVAQRMVKSLLAMLRTESEHQHDCLISGGEPTVRLAEPSIRGEGGRNTQLVLEVYRQLVGLLDDEEWKRFTFLSAGTDGEDGPCDAAGGFINADVHERIVDSHLDVESAIASNDATALLRKANGLFRSGPTGTNVCDLRVVVCSCR
ncbi:MAG: DUF4147 domain-containing protein [Planctomycetota bacterium]